VDCLEGGIEQAEVELGLNGTELGLRASIVSLLRELAGIVGFEVRSEFDGPVDSAISNEIAEHLLVTIREAVANIARHAHASEASVMLRADDGLCQLQVTDNGRGMGGTDTTGGGLGLVNLQRRAEKLHGTLDIESRVGGTVLTWQVPLVAPTARRSARHRKVEHSSFVSP
jgi:signal transduction histidine kinase